ncbi:MAG: phytanoyl-CoA dioxygenase family protein [Fimbriimonadaceae bacterium]|nr:phytanoyl-CoA dioxygenase family protein [Fimbriimonadaceae bacterium]
MTVPASLVEKFRTEGYAVAEGLFTAEECDAYIAHFTAMLQRGGDGYAEHGMITDPNDPLHHYPRLLQPHRGDKLAFDFMIDPRVATHLTALCGTPPLAVQTMFYFKPPQARGQALHQDQRYLNVQPGTCVAAWLALDDCDEENGAMYVVPGSHEFPVLCPLQSDPNESWTGDQVPVPEGMSLVPALMRRGDVLFFNGQLIHGSTKNRSETRFRRTLIAHYIDGGAEQVAQYYFPVWDLNGRDVSPSVGVSEYGGPCGTLRVENGELRVEMTSTIAAATAAH